MIAFPFILNSLLNFVIGLLVARFLGPDEYGHYALAISIAIVLQTLAFDWLRLSATRFYSQHDRLNQPAIRATLNVIFAAIACALVAGAVGIAVSGLDLPLSTGLIGLAITTAVANGLFDFSTALVRALFLNRAYGFLIIAKNLLSVGLTVGGAWYFGSATVALTGLILSVAGSLVISHRALKDQAAKPVHADRKLALRYVIYALPIVVANVLYQTVPATNRAWVSQVHGFAEAGQLALAFDMGIRIIGTIGSTLDVLLFQIAVLAEKTFGAEAAHRQVSRNMGIQLAVVLPAVAGCWLVLPSFELLLVPESFRGPFAQYFALMLPSILCFALTNYCVGPAFQIAHRTAPLILGGLVATCTNALAIVLLPTAPDASNFALSQSIASITGLTVMVGFLFTLEPMWPAPRDILGTLAGTGAMLAIVMPLRAMTPGLATLAAEAGLGLLIYGAAILLFDIARLRSMLMPLVLARTGDRLFSKVR